MGQKDSRLNLISESHFIGKQPIDIAKDIINSSNFYQDSIKSGNLMWKSHDISKWKNYEYKIICNVDKTSLTLYNLSPFKRIPIITSNQETCYICLEKDNIDCKMVCCNQYLHLKCATQMDPSNYCTICRKENIIKIEVYYCKQSEQFIYKKL
jgi:hypothetical protein